MPVPKHSPGLLPPCRVTPDEAARVRVLLADAGVRIAYITCRAAARSAVADDLRNHLTWSDWILRPRCCPLSRAIPVAFTAQGIPAARQPRDGAAGAAVDPYRSKVRLVQACAGGRACYVFDMRFVAWADVAPLFDLPIAVFNAVFEVKRLMHEAKIEPAGRIYDVMTAIWLTDGRRPSLGEAVAINYGLNIPKTLGASDWSADALTPEQLEYAALDAVLCRQLWLTQQTELFDDIDKQCQELADAVTPAIARMELHGMPIDIGAHRKQVAQWEADLAVAQAALCAASPRRDLQMPAELQAHLRDVLDDDELAAWPRTDGGKLATRRQQLQLSSDLPGIAELLQVRALRKLIEVIWRHSDQRDQSCNRPAARQLSDCGREHRALRRARTQPATDAQGQAERLPQDICRATRSVGDGVGLQPDRVASRRGVDQRLVRR